MTVVHYYLVFLFLVYLLKYLFDIIKNMEESVIKQTTIKTKQFRPITSFFSAQKKVLLDGDMSDYSCNNDFDGKFKLLNNLNVYWKLIINNQF